jgi:hypothetical protein
MLNPVKILCLIFGMLLAGTAIAGLAEIKASNSQVGFQFTTLKVDYAETDNAGVLLDTEKGPVPGSAVFFSRMWGSANAYFQAQYGRNEGRTDYVGGLIGPPATPYGSVVTTSAATFTNYSVRLGRGFELGRSALAASGFMLTPYVELGRQEWYRGVNAGETYYHNAYGAGLLWQMSGAGSRLVVSVNGLVGKTFGASIDVTGVFSGALGSSPLYKAGLSVDYALSKSLHLNAGVDYARFAYGKSDVYGGYLEPDSTSTYLIYKAGFGVAF